MHLWCKKILVLHLKLKWEQFRLNGSGLALQFYVVHAVVEPFIVTWVRLFCFLLTIVKCTLYQHHVMAVSTSWSSLVCDHQNVFFIARNTCWLHDIHLPPSCNHNDCSSFSPAIVTNWVYGTEFFFEKLL